jgi:antitoxin ParD1/3/4
VSINVSLPPELEAFVRQHVESGKYGSASEVVREALRLFESYEQVKMAQFNNLRQDIVSAPSSSNIVGAKNRRARGK